jgi:hypothetical protein
VNGKERPRDDIFESKKKHKETGTVSLIFILLKEVK